jgi:hypothetical protein
MQENPDIQEARLSKEYAEYKTTIEIRRTRQLHAKIFF